MKNIKKTIAIIYTISLFSIISSTCFAAVDQFLKIDGVEGETQDEAHKGSIDVLSWSWGSSSSTVGKKTSCNIQDISIVKYVDSSSPDLLVGQLDGTTYSSARLVVRKAGGHLDYLEYIVIELNNVSVTSFSTGGSGGEDRLTESMTLNFTNATYTYTPQKKDGSAGVPIVRLIGGC